MSWYAYDANGYCGDLASIGGWRDFTTWASKQGSAISAFVNQGYTDQPKALAKQLEGTATSGSAESVRVGLLTLSRGADEVLIVSDGEDSDVESKGSVIMPTKGVSSMGVSVNGSGRSHANVLVDSGKVDRDSSWSFSADDGNKLLGANGGDWENYATWFLGADKSADPKTKDYYKFPFGKDDKVFRGALIAAKQRAAQQGYADIEAAADALLAKIDKSKGTATKDSQDDSCDCEDPVDALDPDCDCEDETKAGVVRLSKTEQAEVRRSTGSVERAWSQLEIKSIDDGADGTMQIEGMSSTPETDRMGDIVEPMGARFKLPMPLLWQHDSTKPIGLVDYAKPTSKGIPFKATIAKKGVAPYIDEARNLIRAGLVRGVSIGFRDLKSEPINPMPDDNPFAMLGLSAPGPKRFKEWEWMELSAVTLPANASATIQSIKSIDQQLLSTHSAASGHIESRAAEPSVRHPGVAGQSVSSQNLTKGKTMTTAEQIAAYEAKRAANLGQMNAVMAAAGKESRTLTDEEGQSYDDLETENGTIDKHLTRLRRHEKSLEASAAAVDVAAAGGGSSAADADPNRAHYTGSQAASAAPAAGRGSQTITPFRSNSNLPKGMAFVRYAMLLARAKGNVMLAREFARDPYIKGSTPEVEKAFEAQFQRSAVAAGSSSDATWAGPLVQLMPMASEFVEFLYPMTIIGRIPNFRRVPFNVKMPRQTSSLSSSKWVGQNLPKPVGKIDFETISLGFAKVATIIVMTEDLIRFSNPSSEAIARTDMAEAISKFLDQQFADPSVTAVSNVSPASVTNGAFSHSMSAADIAGVTTDVNTLIGEFTTHNVDPNGAYWLMNPRTAQAIGTLRTSLGVFAFPTISMSGGTLFGMPVLVSNNIALATDSAQHAYAVLVKPSEIFMADDGAVSIDLTNEASLEMDDSPSGGATSLVSLWQNNLVGIRAEQYINWLPRRAHAVAVWTDLTL